MFDAHCHVGPGLRARRPFGPLYEADTADKLIALLDRVGIDRAVAFAPNWEGGWDGTDFIDPGYEQANAAVAEAVRLYPKRLIGFARVNPKYGRKALAELERCFRDYGFRGLKLNNEADPFVPTDLELLEPLVSLCEEHRVPILVHTSFHPSQPLQFLPLAQAHPKVAVILGHMGGRNVIDAIIAAQNAQNLYLETSGIYPMMLDRAIRALGADRLVFGTDLPYNIPEVEVERIRNIGLSTEDQKKITDDNLAGILAAGSRPA
jgi:uncharacterized protein